MEQIITCDNLTFSYGDAESGRPLTPVLEGLDFAVSKGELIAVLGHNGSGKSTLAKHFNAILLPQGGSCTVIGIDTKDEDKLLDIRKRVDEALELVGMYDMRLSAPHQLSGGQKQRVAIAGIIAMRPDCIVLDEPTAMLDPKGRNEVMSTIKALNKYFGTTVVLITHFMDEAASCGRVVVMNNGKIELDDVPERVFSHVERLKQIGLDVPQATELIFELRQAGLDLPTDIIDKKKCVEQIVSLLQKQGV